MQAQEQRYYSPEEYLELEVASDDRHEYINGEIIPMTGGLPNHNRLAGNLYAFLNFALRGKSYDAFFADQRLWIPEKRICTYPDVMVVAGNLELLTGRRDTITNPLMIAEVLSQSTRSYDRDEKFAAYRTIPTFREYVLIDQNRFQVDRYFKTKENEWTFSIYETEESILALASLAFEISLADLYDKVVFEPESL
jgi:Uma2 family endonuclease